MIAASLKMGFQDKRLLLPSILTVLSNIFFGILLLWLGSQKIGEQGSKAISSMASQHVSGPPTHGLLNHPQAGGLNQMLNLTTLNGPGDQSGFAAMGNLFSYDNVILVTSLMMIWWLANRFLEGVTTALVYSHLTEGKGSGKFSLACSAVFQSLPAIIMLGLVTLIAKRIAGWMRNKRNSGFLGMGFNFLAGIVEIFWTLAGHLILPAIVIEGSSFWGGLKRADKIAQGNLLTIGVGEVGVDLICRITSGLVYLGGLAGFGAVYYTHISPTSLPVIASSLLWVIAVVIVTALSIYVRSAFYSCLYVWAIESEAVEEAERIRVKPPEPLAAALA
jgi:hypothetical protein